MNTKIDKYLLGNTVEKLKKLSQGIDPTTNIVFDKDTILNQKQVRSSLIDAYEYLSIFYHSTNINVKTTKLIPFYIDEDELLLLSPQPGETTVSKFTYYVNSIISRPEMKPLKATQVTNWLLEQGILEFVVNDQGKSNKVANEKGRKLGIRTEERINSTGVCYSINLYSTKAQSYLIQNLIAISEFLLV